MSIVLTPNQATEVIKSAIKADTPVFNTGSPGLGKSAMVIDIAKELNWGFIDIRLAQVSPYDLTGLPVKLEQEGRVTRSDYAPMNFIPLEGEELPINPKTNLPYEGMILFLDELNSASKETLKAAYKLILDRMLGNYKLHPNVRIVAAGNLITDGAMVSELPTAIKSRLVNISTGFDYNDFMSFFERKTISDNWSTLVYGFLRFRPDAAYNFDPKSKDRTYACPRTWEYVSKLINTDLLDQDEMVITAAIYGAVGQEAGSEFMSYIEVYRSLPNIHSIIGDPLNAPVPEEIGAKWALGGYLANNINPTNSKPLMEYVKRIPELDIRLIVYRTIQAKYPMMVTDKSVQDDLRAIHTKLKV